MTHAEALRAVIAQATLRREQLTTERTIAGLAPDHHGADQIAEAYEIAHAALRCVEAHKLPLRGEATDAGRVYDAVAYAVSEHLSAAPAHLAATEYGPLRRAVRAQVDTIAAACTALRHACTVLGWQR